MTLPPDERASESPTTAKMRVALLAILMLGMVGILIELFLMEHTDGVWQIVPIMVLVGGICAAGAHAITRTHRNAIRAFQGVMVVFVVSGFAGIILHYTGNVEFEREMNPETGGFGLMREALMGATPALAPGTMIQLGLIGLASTFRHPATGRR